MNQSNTVPSPWQRFKESDFLYYFLRDKVAMFSFAVFMIFLVFALAAPLIAPSDPYDLSSIDIMDSELPPVWMEDSDERFLLGTDEQDEIFYRPCYTARDCH